MENEIPRHRGSKKYKKKTVILQAKYVGNMPLARRMFYNGKWFKWNKYRDEKTAKEAKRSLEKRWKHYIFRVKPKESKK